MAGVLLLVASSARAQEPFAIRGFADAGARTFTATRSLDAILGRHSGLIVGGGVEVVARHGIFGEFRASRFSRTGRRVFVVADHVFPLDVENRITVIPVELTIGYRFDRGRLRPYAGAGVGWHRFRETSPSSAQGEDVSETTVGYHALGGIEIPVWRRIATAAEAQWTTVPNALGRDPQGVSQAFGESNLGGFSARLKILVGF
jgi:hypothetical protein